jgi:FKBP-type peptidyl-prolyl cis-trans isomerase
MSNKRLAIPTSHVPRLTSLFALLLACASAGGGFEGTTFAPSLDVNLAQMTARPSGLYVRDLEPGTGIPAIAGDFVRVEYTLWLANGTRIEATAPGQPLEIRLGQTGQQAVIPAWEEGLTGMKNGGRRRIISPPQLGYGMRPHGQIPGGSVLVFDLHVVYVGR